MPAETSLFPRFAEMCKGLIDFEEQEQPHQPSDVSSYIDVCQRILPSLSCREENYFSSHHISSSHQIVSILHFLPYGVKWRVHFVTEKNRNPWQCGRLLFFCIPRLLPAEVLGVASWQCDAAVGKERCCHGEGASQQQRGGLCVPADAEGFFGSISHSV